MKYVDLLKFYSRKPTEKKIFFIELRTFSMV